MPLLSDATSCFVGNTPVNKIYAGANLVWPKEVYEPNVDVLHRFTLDQTLESRPPYLEAILKTQPDPPFHPITYTAGKFGDCLSRVASHPDREDGEFDFFKLRSFDNSDALSIHFIEAYVKVGIYENERDVLKRDPITLSIYELARRTDFGGMNAAIVFESPQDGEMNVGMKMQSVWMPNDPSDGYDYVPTTLQYESPRWVHVSVAIESKKNNPDSGGGSTKVTWSIDGKVTEKSYILSGLPEPLTTENITIYPIFWSEQKETVQSAPSVFIDEVRTASKPLYTEDFNPA